MPWEWGAVNNARPRKPLVVVKRKVPRLTRKQSLDKLLQPITWSWSSSIAFRQNLVSQRRHDVAVVMPFLTPSERKRAEQWMKDEAHDGLWD